MKNKSDVTIKWSKRERALLYTGPKPTCGMLAYVFETLVTHDDTLTKELEARGYDLTTLRFSIKKKP
jgi:hypothetical protein